MCRGGRAGRVFGLLPVLDSRRGQPAAAATTGDGLFALVHASDQAFRTRPAHRGRSQAADRQHAAAASARPERGLARSARTRTGGRASDRCDHGGGSGRRVQAAPARGQNRRVFVLSRVCHADPDQPEVCRRQGGDRTRPLRRLLPSAAFARRPRGAQRTRGLVHHRRSRRSVRGQRAVDQPAHFSRRDAACAFQVLGAADG